MQILEVHRAQPYLTLNQIAELTERNIRTVQKKVKGIRQEIERGRYNQYAIAGNLVNYYVYIDYLCNEKKLQDKNLRKTVSEFSVKPIEEMSGSYSKLVDIGE